MLTQLEVFTPRVITPALSFVDNGLVETDPIQIRKIEGLGPVTSAISSTQYGGLDGEFYNGASVGKRNIVLTVGLNPNWSDQTIETLRAELYKFFMPKNDVTLRFTSTHMPTCEIDGIVESVEPNLFSQDPEVQVSIVCPYPYFTDVAETVFYGSAGAFSGGYLTPFEYKGTVPTGFRLDLVVNVDKTNLVVKIANTSTTLEEMLLSGVDITSTTSLSVSTLVGDKYAKKIVSGASTNILRQVSTASDWPLVYPGENNFEVGTTDPNQNWSLHYFNRYGGL